MNNAITSQEYLDSFKSELECILKEVSDSKFLAILIRSISHSVNAVIISKKNGIKYFGNSVLKIGNDLVGFINSEMKIARLNKNYYRNLHIRAYNLSKEFGENTSEYIKLKIHSFNMFTTTQKKDLIITGIIWMSTILLAGGGLDMEGGAPDLDIEVGGIGAHRNVLSHSILLPLIIEFLIRVIINLANEGNISIADKEGPIWDGLKSTAVILSKNEDAIVSGLWIGIAIHLLQDANLFSEGVKAYNGIPFHMNEVSHKAVFAGNSFLSFVFGGKQESIPCGAGKKL